MYFRKLSTISEVAVQSALDNLIFSTSKKTDFLSLQYLCLIEKIVLDTKTPTSDKQRVYILHQLLTDIILDQLKKCRYRFKRVVHKNETYESAINAIRADSLSRSDELISWSILYYFYILVDLGLNLDKMSEAIGVTPRTVRRYRAFGVDLLSKELWILERECRNEVHLNRIRQQLGPFHETDFVGRVSEISRVIFHIKNQEGKMFYVHGDKGIGKTAFLKRVITQLLVSVSIDDLLWLDGTQRTDSILLQLQQHFLPEQSTTNLHSVFSLFECVVVIDDCDHLFKSNEFEKILEQLQGAIVFFCSRVYYALSNEVFHIKLHSLSDQDIKDMILKISANELSDDEISHILSISDGNPANIYHLVNFHRYSLPSASIENVLDGLKPEQKHLLSLVPHNDGLLLDDFSRLLTILNLTEIDSNLLFDLAFISRTESHVYVQLKPEVIAKSLDNWFDHIPKILPSISTLDEPWSVVSHILTSYQKTISNDLVWLLIKEYWYLGLIYGNVVRWHSILLSAPKSKELCFSLAIAVSFRQMNELKQAKVMILDLLNLSGQKGDFRIQAEATLELVKIYRLMGQYRQATYHLGILKNTLKTHLNPNKLDTLLLEQAQLALDMDQINYAFSLANSLSSYESMMIKAEALFRMSDYQSCLELCSQLLSESQLPDIMRGIIHNMIGRCQQIVDVELAIGAYHHAIEFFSRTFRLRHLSRAQINLATTFIYREEPIQAIEILKRAEEICFLTNDRICIEVIEQNKSYIRRMISSTH